jgi:hypothetical protein
VRIELINNKMIASLLAMSSGDSMLAILVGLLGAFLIHVSSKMVVYAIPFHVRTHNIICSVL